jgi:hypothetical protein
MFVGKGDLHAHMCIIQPTLQPSAVMQSLQSHATQLAKFAETLMCRIVPDVPRENLVLSTSDPKPAAYQVPLTIPTCRSESAHLDAATASAQLDLQLHHHTHTCKKQGFAGNNWSCRVSMPRPVVANTSVFKDTSTLLVKCNNGHIAPHLKSLLLAQPCNMAVWLSCEASSFYRDYHIWALGNLHGISTAAPPALPSDEAFAAEKAEYALKYTTKNDSYDLSSRATEAAMGMLENASNSVARAKAPGNYI